MGDDQSISLLIGLLFFLLILSALTSCSEAALLSVNRYRLKHKALKGNKAAILTEKLLEKPDRLIGLILLINNAVNVSSASIVTLITLRIGGEGALVIGSIILTLVLLIFAEITPKTFALKYPSKIALPASLIYYPLLKIFSPVVLFVSFIVNLVLKLFGFDSNDLKGQALNSAELKAAVTESGEYVPDDHQQMLLTILDLENIDVDDVMVPRQEIIGLDLNEPWEDSIKVLKSTKYSRLPLYRDDIDQIIGVVRVRDVLSDIMNPEFSESQLLRKIQTPFYIPEGTPLSKQLINFKEHNHRFAFVVDEYGDIQGIVTIEDVIREIIGDINKIDKATDHELHKLSENKYRVDAGMSIRKVNRLLAWTMPNKGQTTINGLVLELLGEMPEKGHNFSIENYVIEVLESNDHMIKTVSIEQLQSA